MTMRFVHPTDEHTHESLLWTQEAQKAEGGKQGSGIHAPWFVSGAAPTAIFNVGEENFLQMKAG